MKWRAIVAREISEKCALLTDVVPNKLARGEASKTCCAAIAGRLIFDCPLD
jgi:hypothetical protein